MASQGLSFHYLNGYAETALRKGCLDYRALMRTNFLHGTGSVNLFDLVIEELLVNYPLVSVGPIATIGKLWQEVLDSLPKTHHRRRLERINDVVTRFNQAVDPVWPELQTKAEAILKAFPGCGAALQFDFPGVAYDIQERQLTRKHLYLAVDLNGKRIPEHQHFLNEA